MAYLEFHISSKQVVGIYVDEPVLSDDYDYCISESFSIGDEFEYTIWINEVNENRELVSYSAIRNNPNAQRLLRDNVKLKESQADLWELILFGGAI